MYIEEVDRLSNSLYFSLRFIIDFMNDSFVQS